MTDNSCTWVKDFAIPGDALLMDVRVTWWRRYGQNRLFVEQDGERLGWMDLRDGTTVVTDTERREEVFSALERYIASRVVPRQR